jgi:hypothetical protein
MKLNRAKMVQQVAPLVMIRIGNTRRAKGDQCALLSDDISVVGFAFFLCATFFAASTNLFFGLQVER